MAVSTGAPLTFPLGALRWPNERRSTASGMVVTTEPLDEKTVMVWRYIMFAAMTRPLPVATTDFGENGPTRRLVTLRVRRSLGTEGFGGTVAVTVGAGVVGAGTLAAPRAPGTLNCAGATLPEREATSAREPLLRNCAAPAIAPPTSTTTAPAAAAACQPRTCTACASLVCGG